MSKAPTPAASGNVALDPETSRCLKELRAMIASIESGELALRRFYDDLTEQNGLHREVLIRVTYVPKVTK